MTLKAHVKMRRLFDPDVAGLYSRLDFLSRLNYGVSFEELLSKRSCEAYSLIENLTYNYVFLTNILVKAVRLRMLCDNLPENRAASTAAG
ncbi:MAG: hypothetical protein ACK4H7_03935 [Acidilobaceae archaeon]